MRPARPVAILIAGLLVIAAGCAEAPKRPPEPPPIPTLPPPPAEPAAMENPASTVRAASVGTAPVATSATPAATPPATAATAMAPPEDEPEPPVVEGPPPDLEFVMMADDAAPPDAANEVLARLVARLKGSGALSLRLTLFAPPVASREYALGLTAKASETLRRHLRTMGVPARKIIRVVIDPRRATVSGDERIRVQIRLQGGR